MEVDIGRRIKFFRKRANISQLDLEFEIEASSGMISRIEGNMVNPTKETITKIAKVLNLNKFELDYLIGQSILPVTQEEIEKAIEEASAHLNEKNKLAYLLDDRWRFFEVSDAFIKLLKIGPEEYNYVIGKTTAQIITDLNSPAIKWVDKEKYEELLRLYLPIYYSRMSYMEDDEIYQQTLSSIEKNPKARKIWQEIKSKGVRKFAPKEERIIPFDIWGVKFKLFYVWNELPVNSRFEIVEYYTDSKVLNLLKRFV